MIREKKKKGVKEQRVKPNIPTWVIDMFIGDKEQNGGKKKMKETRTRFPTSYPGAIWSPFMSHMNHTIDLL